MADHKFSIGDKVVYTNDFGVCWGVKTISGLDDRGFGPTYHYEGSETPWFSVDESNFVLANGVDIIADAINNTAYFQEIHGFTPTLEQLGGCG